MTTPPPPLPAVVDAEQLELFPAATVGPGSHPARLDREIARASVSPGWWPYLAPLWAGGHGWSMVTQCREVDGMLEIELVEPAGSTWDPAPDVEHLRTVVADRCGCCGGRPASRYRRRIDEPTRVVCADCRTRLSAGEHPLEIADDFFHFDGTAREVPRSRGQLRSVHTGAGQAAEASPGRSLDEPMSAEELRHTIAEIRQCMAREVVGQAEAVTRLALLGGLHVGAALPRGARALIMGPSGVGKSTLAAALRHALERWQLPYVASCLTDITSPGWSGAPSIGQLIAEALGEDLPDSPRSRRAVIVLDEIHHMRVVPGTYGNMRAHREEVLASLLGLTGRGTVHLGEGTELYDCSQTLVLALGAFTGLNLQRPVTIRRLAKWGISLELANRIAEEVVVLKPLPETALIDLLRTWPELLALTGTCKRLGHEVRILDEAYARAARVVTLGHDASTPRTAGGWLVSALRAALVRALDRSEPTELVITPDSLPIPASATRPLPPREPPPEAPGGWDTTIVLTPR